MATGTEAGLLDGPRPPSVYKHGILEQYAIRYATMTASKLEPKRSVLFDGFAGRGRFDTGEAASAEHMMLAAQKMKTKTQIDIFLVEKKKSDFRMLDNVADQYRHRGIDIRTRHGECAHYLPEAMAWAKGASLFVFLDPCGAVLPFDILAPLLKQRGTWPRTEFLINFNADLIRRAGGQYKKGLLHLDGVKRADDVCGGEWWRQVALEAHKMSGCVTWESAAEAVATEYARRLTAGTRFGYVVSPVRRQVHHQPVYFLIFLTTALHGFWEFGDAAAKAREKWLKALKRDDQAPQGTLFDPIEDQIDQEHRQAIAHITKNIRALVSDGHAKDVVKFTTDIFRGVYGEAKETAFSAALRQLVSADEVEFVKKGAKPRLHRIRRKG